MDINIFLAFIAGFISFLSPCIFPVIPSYLSYIGGLGFSDLSGERKEKWNLLLNSILFVAGFTLIFTVMGVFFSSIGFALSGISSYINKAAGVMVMLLGLNFIFNFWKFLNLEKRFHFKNRPNGKTGSIFLGMAFGAGWTPCIGPILASILFVAGTSGSIYKGAILLFAFSTGLGIPFIAAGFFFSFFQNAFIKIRPHLKQIKIGSGLFLIMIGILIFSGQLSRMNIILYLLAENIRKWEIDHIYGSRAVYGSIFLIPALSVAALIRIQLLSLREKNQKLADFPVLHFILFILLTLLSGLAFTGIIDTGELIQKWLTFQGI
jgi:cytochrome c-type biogenesis protein